MGLSPYTRGNPCRPDPSECSILGVYPRTHGGTIYHVSSIRDNCCRGSIPVHTGEPLFSSRLATGETVLGQRSIPVHTGEPEKTTSDEVARVYLIEPNDVSINKRGSIPVHTGEPVLKSMPQTRSRSSPYTRGNRRYMNRSQPGDFPGSIPVHTGEPLLVRHYTKGLSPYTRGNLKHGCSFLAGGLSPYTRGNHLITGLVRCSTRELQRVYPRTHGGTAATLRISCLWHRGVYPRTHGGTAAAF